MKAKRMPFGKHKNKPISELPPSYALWLWNNVDLARWGIEGAVKDALGLSDDEGGDEGDDAALGELQERLEQAVFQAQQLQQRLLGAQAENEQLKRRMKTAYRKLSFRCHPDRGGDHETMVLVNELLGE
jgi:hypothetical protein